MRVEEIQKKVSGSLALDSIYPSAHVIELNKMFLEGKITSREVIQRVKIYYLKRRF